VTGTRPTSEQQRSEDAHELHALGYAQELFRTMGGFSNFAISFSIISILTGAVTLFEHGLVMGGPAEMAFGWPLVTADQLSDTCCLLRSNTRDLHRGVLGRGDHPRSRQRSRVAASVAQPV
jgi:hypothetical protein